MKRLIYMISDGTGITVESLGNSLITQFELIDFEKKIIPFVDTPEKAQAIVHEVNHYAASTGEQAIVFMTLVNPNIATYIQQAHACVLDLFNTFIGPLEHAFGMKSSYTVGRTHSVADTESYEHRIRAINYALAHDDGVKTRGYEEADIILIGVSRSGKTPSCLYMALQFGILAANYPFTPEDMIEHHLPHHLVPYRTKLFGLTIDPQRLQHIRSERRPHSEYASSSQCRREIMEVEQLYRRERIPFMNSTHYSIEEISTKIMSMMGLQRRI